MMFTDIYIHSCIQDEFQTILIGKFELEDKSYSRDFKFSVRLSYDRKQLLSDLAGRYLNSVKYRFANSEDFVIPERPVIKGCKVCGCVPVIRCEDKEGPLGRSLIACSHCNPEISFSKEWTHGDSRDTAIAAWLKWHAAE